MIRLQCAAVDAVHQNSFASKSFGVSFFNSSNALRCTDIGQSIDMMCHDSEKKKKIDKQKSLEIRAKVEHVKCETWKWKNIRASRDWVEMLRSGMIACCEEHFQRTSSAISWFYVELFEKGSNFVVIHLRWSHDCELFVFSRISSFALLPLFVDTEYRCHTVNPTN